MLLQLCFVGIKMEVAADLSTIWGDSHLVKLDNAQLRRLHPRKCDFVPHFIDKMGLLSSEAQGLRKILTSYEKLVDCQDEQNLYILWEASGRQNLSMVIGILKVGRKQLYLYTHPETQRSECVQTSPLCILDFYVHHSRQRRGYGHLIYDFMLKAEGVPADGVAIDKPSESLLSFMTKHYGLRDPVWQTTKFVVYPSFFTYIDRHSRSPIPVFPSDARSRSEKVQLVDSFNSPTSPRKDSLDSTPVSPRSTTLNHSSPSPSVPPRGSLFNDHQTPSLVADDRQFHRRAWITGPGGAVEMTPSTMTPAQIRHQTEVTPSPIPQQQQARASRLGSPARRPIPGNLMFTPVHVGNVSGGGGGRGDAVASEARPSSSASDTAKQRKIASMHHQSWY